MKDRTVIQVKGELLKRIRQLKKDTGKSMERIVAEALEAGLAVKKFM